MRVALSLAFAAVARSNCPVDTNGVAGASCLEVCECGTKACDDSVEGKDFSRCYEHDFAYRLDEEHDCEKDVRCCIPEEECAEECSLPVQEELAMFFNTLSNVSSDECTLMFTNQAHGNPQDEYELCTCIQEGLATMEDKGSIEQWTALNEVVTSADCRISAGERLTMHEITLQCMSTSVVGDPILAVGEEKIKFFLPPGEMVDLVTWASPSGKPIVLRGSTFQTKGSKKTNFRKNVQWFRRFELLVANDTVLEITSHHKHEPPLTASLLALQPEDDATIDFAEAHAKRKSYVEVKFDGKEIMPQPAAMKTVVLESERAKEIGLKLTAVQTKEHKIGGELSERVDVVTDKFRFRVWSSKAGKFSDPKMQVKYAHLNFDIMGPFPPNVGGFFAELRGKVPMTERSKTFLRKVDLQPVARER